MRVIYLLALILLSNDLYAQTDSLDQYIIVGSSAMTDERDGQVYKTITYINGQTWMVENMNFYLDWKSWCYNDTTENCNKHGRLYSTLMEYKICPSGWHLPTKAEFELFLGMFDDESDAYNKLTTNSANYSRFNVLFSGSRNDYYGVRYVNIGEVAGFWSSTEDESGDPLQWYLEVNKNTGIAIMETCYFNYGKSCRCIKDK